MKKSIRVISLLLILPLVFVTPIYAEEVAMPYASAFFSATETYVYIIDGNRIGVWFEVLAKHQMDELGVRSIVMQKSADGTTWRDVKTFTPENYSQMISENDTYHADGVPYTGTYRYYYRAYVEFYAKDGNSSGVYFTYTDPFYLSV